MGIWVYIYQNHYNEYFAISNSFLLLQEYLVNKQKISLNKDFCDNFVISSVCSPSLYETLIKEITKIQSNSFIIINVKQKSFKIYNKDYEENTIPLESKEGLQIIDKWIDKWGYIIRSLKYKTSNIACNLSGGFDTRVILSIFLNSGINLNSILINSKNDTKHSHVEDFKIATNISSKFKFKLNNYNLDTNGSLWSLNDTLSCSFYSKLGFHKEFYWQKKFLYKPRFIFSGGGELRGYPNIPIRKYIEEIASFGNHLGKEFYNSSKRMLDRSVDSLKKNSITRSASCSGFRCNNLYNNEYKISSDFYHNGREINHDGKATLEAFIANLYIIQPMIDIDIRKIKFNINNSLSHDLLAYIYVRFAHDLIHFPIQGNRTINFKSIENGERLNKLIPPYKIQNDYNKNFYIDTERTSPVKFCKDKNNIDSYLKKLFLADNIRKTINKIYNSNIYKYAKEYTKNQIIFLCDIYMGFIQYQGY